MSEKAIVVEYQIQNDSNLNASHAKTMNPGSAHTYPNMFILPKRYTSIGQVKVADVIRAFPQ